MATVEPANQMHVLSCKENRTENRQSSPLHIVKSPRVTIEPMLIRKVGRGYRGAGRTFGVNGELALVCRAECCSHDGLNKSDL